MAEYETGYKKPPREHQFKKGNRANPKGRGSKKSYREGDIMKDLLNAKIEITDQGIRRRASRIELTIRAYGAAALKGDVGSAAMLLKIRAEGEKHGDINPVFLTFGRRDMGLL